MGRQTFLNKHKTLANLPNNSRFYVLASSIILSLFVAAWLRTQITSDQLFYIRLQQIFGFLAVIYLYVAVIISPLGKAVGDKRRAIQYVSFARRAIGVSAAYFALLHTVIAVWAQMGGLPGIGLLPGRFQLSLIFGLVGLVVLLAMAGTSFDRVIRFMTFRRWKWLHRLVYGGSILIILHVWMIGTHASYTWIKATAFIALAVFFGLEALRVTRNLAKRFAWLDSKDYIITIASCLWFLWIVLLLALPGLVPNYHSEHHHSPAVNERVPYD